ncbi:hypothetical protein AMV244 [Betaentomopoxvirus amoorei]|uniref:AMV244 n=1 Tax=Amsacta moorei entomopoxvirus TaxID=28321 RepID=Q9EMG2_AMEPV|nr:hypothetical protein AMV244 [Amsacta moorei entomopoxvirus]AAG02950.1 AMV244 [Amsacta moorei entomopoxvirus]
MNPVSFSFIISSVDIPNIFSICVRLSSGNSNIVSPKLCNNNVKLVISLLTHLLLKTILQLLILLVLISFIFILQLIFVVLDILFNLSINLVYTSLNIVLPILILLFLVCNCDSFILIYLN